MAGFLHQGRKEFEPRMNTDEHGSNETTFGLQLRYLYPLFERVFSLTEGPWGNGWNLGFSG
jgi:hypothetical protein